jgi:Leucine-rich repeat (LRR) protein
MRFGSFVCDVVEVGNLDELRRLSLHGNQLNGNIPASLGNCSSLHALYLFDN